MLPTALLLASALATGVSAPDQADLEARVDALMADYSGDVPGASVLVVHDGSVVLRKAYGLADVENGIAATTATNYRLASVTKQFTAAAILLLAEDGRLDLHDPVRRWLPTLPPTPGAATLHQLLTHSSGILDYEDYVPATAVTAAQRANRAVLVDAMARHGFANYPMEWWHFTLDPEPAPGTAFDVPVR